MSDFVTGLPLEAEQEVHNEFIFSSFLVFRNIYHPFVDTWIEPHDVLLSKVKFYSWILSHFKY